MFSLHPLRSCLTKLDSNSLPSDFSVSVVILMFFVFDPEPSASPARFWPDCCDLCPPVIKQIVFWILFLGLGCLFWLQKLHERRQHQAEASLAASSHTSPLPSASPVPPPAAQPVKPT